MVILDMKYHPPTDRDKVQPATPTAGRERPRRVDVSAEPSMTPATRGVAVKPSRQEDKARTLVRNRIAISTTMSTCQEPWPFLSISALGVPLREPQPATKG